MRKSIIQSVAALLAVTALLVAGLVALEKGSAGGTREAAGSATGTSTSEAPVTGRPDCPAGSVGGVDLGCLGGAEGASGESELTVVNLWAWWCEPCRGELPIVGQFADAHPEYTVVGVHADPSASRGAALLDELGVDLPSYQDDDNRFAGTLGLPGVVPLTVVIRDGKQVATFPRVFHSVAELEQAVGGAA